MVEKDRLAVSPMLLLFMLGFDLHKHEQEECNQNVSQNVELCEVSLIKVEGLMKTIISQKCSIAFQSLS